MAELPRLNGIIKALEEGHVAFIGSGPADGLAGVTAPYDGVNFEAEHAPYDIAGLTEALQSMLDRRQIAQRIDQLVGTVFSKNAGHKIARLGLDFSLDGLGDFRLDRFGRNIDPCLTPVRFLHAAPSL